MCEHSPFLVGGICTECRHSPHGAGPVAVWDTASLHVLCIVPGGKERGREGGREGERRYVYVCVTVQVMLGSKKLFHLHKVTPHDIT